VTLVARYQFQEQIRAVDGIEFRGLNGYWPRPLRHPVDRRGNPFGGASWPSTVRLLKHELRQVHALNVRLSMALPDEMIRQDGLPRAGARPDHPGVILSFDKPGQGRLVYPCDTYQDWQANVRAIAWTLEALRTPQRHGVLIRGEQYVGSRLLTAGGTAVTMTSQAAAQFLARHCVFSVATLLQVAEAVEDGYRAAARSLHPDAGGSAGQMDLATKARDTLRAHHGVERAP
jgi:hypothetical protein